MGMAFFLTDYSFSYGLWAPSARSLALKWNLEAKFLVNSGQIPMPQAQFLNFVTAIVAHILGKLSSANGLVIVGMIGVHSSAKISNTLLHRLISFFWWLAQLLVASISS